MQDDEAAGFLQRLIERSDDLLAGSFFRLAGFFGESSSGHGHRRSLREFSVEQALGDDRDAAGFVDVGGDVFSGRLQVREQRRALADFLEVVDGERDSHLARHRQQVQHGVGRSAGAGDAGDRVLERGAGQDVSRRDAFLQQIHNDLAALERDFVLAGVHGGNAVEAHGREADQLHHRRHGVGGVLAAARAGAGTGDVFDFEQFGVGHLAGGVRADGFEHILNGDVFAVILAGRDRAAVEHQAGEIQAQQRHGRRGDGLVAAHQRRRRRRTCGRGRPVRSSRRSLRG